MEDFIPMGSEEEAKRIKRKGINLEQGSEKKQKTLKKVTEEAQPPKEVLEEKVNEMMQLVPIEEVLDEVNGLGQKYNIVYVMGSSPKETKPIPTQKAQPAYGLQGSINTLSPHLEKGVLLVFISIKRIYRYLKGHPKLGLWYPKESPFDLLAYSDSDYGGATQDRKSTTGGCQFLGRRLILWQCKKQTIVATSKTEAEYIAAASCCGQVSWIQNQLHDYGPKLGRSYTGRASLIQNPEGLDFG
nr:putative ribonuclease H-like domain-containing protein [Tanacetum cinerariifolium]